jgi:hypothetical protein
MADEPTENKITDEKKLEMFDKLKGVLSRMGASQPNAFRLKAMLDKIQAGREAAEGPRRIEHTGGYFKYPPLDASDAASVYMADTAGVQKAAVARLRPPIVTDQPGLGRLRKLWLDAKPAARP